jgi:hypothetical protein
MDALPHAKSAIYDMPHAHRYSYDVNFQYGDLAQKRDALLNGLPESIPQLPIEHFFNHLLPRFKVEDCFDDICKAILSKRLFDQKKKRWSKIGSSKNERKNYKELEAIQKEIVEIAKQYLDKKKRAELGCLVTFASDTGSKSPKSDWELPNRTRPDGGIYTEVMRRKKKSLKKSMRYWHWSDLICPYAFKVSETTKPTRSMFVILHLSSSAHAGLGSHQDAMVRSFHTGS